MYEESAIQSMLPIIRTHKVKCKIHVVTLHSTCIGPLPFRTYERSPYRIATV